jgi:hypothetical protein
MITTDSSSTGPAPCGSGTQILGIQGGDGTEISYALVTGNSGVSPNTDLVRNVCLGSSVISTVVSHDVPATQTATVTCSVIVVGECAGSPPQYATGWIPVLGLTGVTLQVTQPKSQFAYTLVAVPEASTNSSNPTSGSTPPTGCSFATPGTGLYASALCFVDFSSWNTQTSQSSKSCAAGSLGMSVGIANTPYTMSFCVSAASVTSGGAPIVGNIAGGGFNGIAAVPLPTYSSPGGKGGSEAFLGNNGFYTDVPGDPALYTTVSGSTSTISFSNIEVLNADGIPVTGWELVTGDAESTDTNESISWSTGAGGPALNLLNNSNTPLSPVGNDCESITPGFNTTDLTGTGTSTVQCVATSQVDKTGTVMLESQAPSSLTVKMVGAGLQAMFLGLLLT